MQQKTYITYIHILQLVNSEGTWVKLDVESMQKYCHELNGEAWSLARDTHDILYIQNAAEVREREENMAAFSFTTGSENSPAAQNRKGFDFTSAPQTPTFSVFGAASQGPGIKYIPYLLLSFVTNYCYIIYHNAYGQVLIF